MGKSRNGLAGPCASGSLTVCSQVVGWNFNISSSAGAKSALKPTQCFLVGFASSSAVRQCLSSLLSIGRGHAFLSAVSRLLPSLLSVFWWDLLPHQLSGRESQLVAGYWQRTSFLLCSVALSTRASLWEEPERIWTRWEPVFCDLITEVQPITLASFYLLEENLPIWLTHKGRRSLGDYVEAFCHSPLISSPVSHPLIPVVF